MPSRSTPLRRSVPKTALRIPKRERARRRRALKREWDMGRRMIGHISSGAFDESSEWIGRWRRDVEMAMGQPYDPPPKPRAHPKFPVSTRRPKRRRQR